ncbi:unnamed protein product [Angiostrongylus costaricensis]|uniref:CUB domain-containing protein n=1 Tax=Angiostrongylus costaricensis TaxID=334426 RepID=A0A158PL38_ANGCS|nr:unnamed protein product [Angiostrongylus costaricensis]
MRPIDVVKTKRRLGKTMNLKKSDFRDHPIPEHSRFLWLDEMRVISLSFLISCVNVYSSIMRAEPSANKKSFEEKPQEGYQLLKDKPNATDTKIPGQLDDVEEEIEEKLATFSPEKYPSMKYKEGKGSELNGGTTEEITENGKDYTPFFEGDIILTKSLRSSDSECCVTEEDETMYDEEHGESERVKRQVHRNVTRISSNNNEPVIIPQPDGRYLQTLGSPMISFYDKLAINLHYKCFGEKTNVVTNTGRSVKMVASPIHVNAGDVSALVDMAEDIAMKGDKHWKKCQNGGFPHPRECWRCVCPSGYGGRYCNERPGGCGKTLYATTWFNRLVDTVGREDYHPDKPHDEFIMCNYWIKAQAGSTIEMRFDNYSRDGYSDGCVNSGVEIKTGNDTRLTGYRLCDDRSAGMSFNSTRNIVPVITYNRFSPKTTVLSYRIGNVNFLGSDSMPLKLLNTITRFITVSSDATKCKDSAMYVSFPTKSFPFHSSKSRVCFRCSVLLRLKPCTFSTTDGFRRKYCPKSCGFCL